MDQKLSGETNTQESQGGQPQMSEVNTTPSIMQGEVSSQAMSPAEATGSGPMSSSSPEGLPQSGQSSQNVAMPQQSSSSAGPGVPTPGAVAGLPPKNSSHLGLIIAIVLLVIAVLGGAFGLAMMQNKPQSAVPPTPIAQPTVAEPTPTSLPTPSTDEVSGTTGTSNEQLQKDTETLEATITGVAEDTQTVDEGLNDQQTDLR